jgi:hypothetical protein
VGRNPIVIVEITTRRIERVRAFFLPNLSPKIFRKHIGSSRENPIGEVPNS